MDENSFKNELSETDLADVESDDDAAGEPDNTCKSGSAQLVPSEFLCESEFTSLFEDITLNKSTLLLFDEDIAA